MNKYPHLRMRMERESLTVRDLAEAAGIAERGIRDRLRGVHQWTLDEAMAVRRTLFPDETVDSLFQTDSS